MFKFFSVLFLAAALLPAAAGPARAGVGGLTVEELYRAYTENSEESDRRLRNKKLEVTGRAVDFYNDEGQGVMAIEDWDNDGVRPGCLMYSIPAGNDDEVVRAVTKMIRGEPVTVTCEFYQPEYRPSLSRPFGSFKIPKGQGSGEINPPSQKPRERVRSDRCRISYGCY